VPQYMLLLYAGEVDEAGEAERWAELPVWNQISDSLRESGVLVTNAPLHPVQMATTVRVRDGETELTDGPFAVPYRVPGDAELPARLPSVLRVTYLIFNEGYTASEGDTLVRGELCAEAIRLGRLLCELMPGEPEAWGLLSLMLLHDARRAARVSASGDWVGLLEQDPAQWDRARIEEGLATLEYALRAKRPGEYQLQAAIAALHIRGVAAGETDWAQLAQLYGRLAARSRSPVAALNHAAAVGFAAGPERGLELIAPLLGHPALARYQPLHATHADLLRRAGHKAAATRAYERAISLSANTVERAELERRRQSL
jgi:RNA polymerase sigma-70 factor, ECF subfamily